ncbi:MAG TPA: mercury methylation corrinoid protein HgcA [Opitutaceae bacterium]|nr:mercury methylation corrinoid protein HgcA [Opitutaceae bacterium]
MSACTCSPIAGGHPDGGFIPVQSDWTQADWLGALAVRLNVGRMDYRVAPGLYAAGRPDAAAPVFVTANYKLSFDHLRRALRGLDAWLLVLDTHGVNVWCAAGKGTFSTAELNRQIEVTGLSKVVSHRRLILPQLGAVGVAAHAVAQATGFTVIYGPVRAGDIPAWLNAGRRKDSAMRTVRFSFWDRLVLVPVEIVNGRTHLLTLAAVALVLALIRVRGFDPPLASSFAGYATLLLGSALAACIFLPLLLPWLPTRSFSIKGATIGLILTACLAVLAPAYAGSGFWAVYQGGWAIAGSALAAGAIAAFVGLNFTGATVFTSQSGTLLETKRALPVIAGAAFGGLALQIIGAFCNNPS